MYKCGKIKKNNNLIEFREGILVDSLRKVLMDSFRKVKEKPYKITFIMLLQLITFILLIYTIYNFIVFRKTIKYLIINDDFLLFILSDPDPINFLIFLVISTLYCLCYFILIALELIFFLLLIYITKKILKKNIKN